eukprot:scaffold14458_cov66-Phaeocystis_antarctica.AAC.3
MERDIREDGSTSKSVDSQQDGGWHFPTARAIHALGSRGHRLASFFSGLSVASKACLSANPHHRPTSDARLKAATYSATTPRSSRLHCTEHEAGTYDVDGAEEHHRDVAGRAVLDGGGGAVGGPAAAKVREQRPCDERPQGAAEECGDPPHAQALRGVLERGQHVAGQRIVHREEHAVAHAPPDGEEQHLRHTHTYMSISMQREGWEPAACGTHTA